MKAKVLDYGLPTLALLFLGLGTFMGLIWAPPEKMMGDVYRIIYVHVPNAWVGLLACSINFVASVLYLVRDSWKADAMAEASGEVGVLFATLLIMTGSIWGRPTWGVWWTWDPRLTTAAILLVAYAGYLALRRFIDEPERRATWSAVAAILIAANIYVVWKAVDWWNTLHQMRSSPSDMSPEMAWSLHANAWAFLLLYLTFLRFRYRLGRKRQQLELAPPPVSQTESQRLATGESA